MTPLKVLAFSFGPVGAAVFGIISLPIVTWLFSQEDVGRLSMLQVVLAFSTLFFSLGLDQAYVRNFHDESDKASLLKHSMMPGLVLISLVVFLSVACGLSLSDVLFGYQLLALSVIVVVALVVDLVVRFLSLILRMNEQGLAFSIVQLVPKLSFLVLLGFYALADSELNLVALVFANVFGGFLVALFLCYYTRRELGQALKSSFSIAKLLEMLKFGAPLIVGGVAYWGLSSIDKVFLRSFVGYEELAVYSVAMSFAGVAILLQNVFSLVWAPTVYKWVSKSEGLSQVNVVTRYILFAVVVLFCLAGMFSWVLTIFLPASYVQVKWIMVVCLSAPLLYTLSEATGIGIGISKRTGFSMVATLVAFVLNLVGNWILVPMLGAAGAAISTSLSFWVYFWLRTEFSILLWRPLSRHGIYGWTLAALVLSYVSVLYGEELEVLVFCSWSSLFLVSIWSFRVEFVALLAYLHGFINRKPH